MPTMLQKLITKSLEEGKTYRAIEKECGVDHSNLSRYHTKGTTPDSKNLVMLAKYYGVEFHELLEEVTTMKNGVKPSQLFIEGLVRRANERQRERIIKAVMAILDQDEQESNMA